MSLLRRLGIGATILGSLYFSKDVNAQYVENDYTGTVMFDGQPALESDVLKLFWEGEYTDPIHVSNHRIGDGNYLIQAWANRSGLIDFGLERDGDLYVPLFELGPDEARFDASDNGARWHVNIEYFTNNRDPNNEIFGNVVYPDQIDRTPTPPEPSTVALFLVGLPFLYRRKVK
ncbi:MAG: PEP-CTERM sorting domain-containing protein [Nanoarchaeota archaeon]